MEDESDDDQDENEDKYEPLRQVDYQRLEAERQKFNGAIDTLDSALVRLQQLCLSNVNHLRCDKHLSIITFLLRRTITRRLSRMFLRF